MDQSFSAKRRAKDSNLKYDPQSSFITEPFREQNLNSSFERHAVATLGTGPQTREPTPRDILRQTEQHSSAVEHNHDLTLDESIWKRNDCALDDLIAAKQREIEVIRKTRELDRLTRLAQRELKRSERPRKMSRNSSKSRTCPSIAGSLRKRAPVSRQASRHMLRTATQESMFTSLRTSSANGRSCRDSQATPSRHRSPMRIEAYDSSRNVGRRLSQALG